jgi:hypothetical protein
VNNASAGAYDASLGICTVLLICCCRIATKKAYDKVQQWSEDCWLEMGVCLITLYAYKMVDGKFAVDL